jgi:cytoskeleton protein RodZ
MSSEKRQEQSQSGQRLREARLQAGLTLEEVARRTHIEQRHLQALEQDQPCDSLNSTFVNGYMRSYARCLGVDPESLPVTAVEPLVAAEASAAKVSRRQSAAYQHHKNRTYYGVALTALIMASLWWFQRDPRPSSLNITELSAIEVETAAGPVIESLDQTEDEAVAEPLAAVVSYDASAVEQQEASVLGEGSVDVAVAAMDTERSELSFYFSDDCWIQVIDGGGQVIHESVAKKQQSLMLEGKPPFQVTLGYAPAVSLSYNGEPVAIKVSGSRRVAKLILGNS